MTRNRIVGIALLAAGAALLSFGYEASPSVAEQLQQSFTGRLADSTMWSFVLGGVAAAAGIGLLVFPHGASPVHGRSKTSAAWAIRSEPSERRWEDDGGSFPRRHEKTSRTASRR